MEIIINFSAMHTFHLYVPMFIFIIIYTLIALRDSMRYIWVKRDERLMESYTEWPYRSYLKQWRDIMDLTLSIGLIVGMIEVVISWKYIPVSERIFNFCTTPLAYAGISFIATTIYYFAMGLISGIAIRRKESIWKRLTGKD